MALPMIDIFPVWTICAYGRNLDNLEDLVRPAIRESISELSRLFGSIKHPFPYKDCRKLQRQDASRYEGFVADLDLYLKDIAGYCTWGERILEWSKPEIEKASRILSRSFFEKNPDYTAMESLITKENTPNLYEMLNSHEAMRATLFRLLSLLPRQADTEV